MYCHTHLSMELKRLTALGNFDCMYCPSGQQRNAIEEGQEFLWINGYRTYEKIFWESDIVQRKKHRGLYIPKGIINPRNITDPAFFKDFIRNRKMCSNCAESLEEFFNLKMRSGDVVKIHHSHTKRHYSAIKNYFCSICTSEILAGNGYIRVGHHDCYCISCIHKIEGVLGKEYSY